MVHCNASDPKGKPVILAKGKVHLNTKTQYETAWLSTRWGFIMPLWPYIEINVETKKINCLWGLCIWTLLKKQELRMSFKPSKCIEIERNCNSTSCEGWINQYKFWLYKLLQYKGFILPNFKSRYPSVVRPSLLCGNLKVKLKSDALHLSGAHKMFPKSGKY